jgi:hypothetical protein
MRRCGGSGVFRWTAPFPFASATGRSWWCVVWPLRHGKSDAGQRRVITQPRLGLFGMGAATQGRRSRQPWAVIRCPGGAEGRNQRQASGMQSSPCVGPAEPPDLWTWRKSCARPRPRMPAQCSPRQGVWGTRFVRRRCRGDGTLSRLHPVP